MDNPTSCRLEYLSLSIIWAQCKKRHRQTTCPSISKRKAFPRLCVHAQQEHNLFRLQIRRLWIERVLSSNRYPVLHVTFLTVFSLILYYYKIRSYAFFLKMLSRPSCADILHDNIVCTFVLLFVCHRSLHRNYHFKADSTPRKHQTNRGPAQQLAPLFRIDVGRKDEVYATSSQHCDSIFTASEGKSSNQWI